MVLIASLVMTLWFIALMMEVTFGGLIHLLFLASLILAAKAVVEAETELTLKV